MKVSCNEDVANHVGSKSCAATREGVGENSKGSGVLELPVHIKESHPFDFPTTPLNFRPL